MPLPCPTLELGLVVRPRGRLRAPALGPSGFETPHVMAAPIPLLNHICLDDPPGASPLFSTTFYQHRAVARASSARAPAIVATLCHIFPGRVNPLEAYGKFPTGMIGSCAYLSRRGKQKVLSTVGQMHRDASGVTSITLPRVWSSQGSQLAHQRVGIEASVYSQPLSVCKFPDGRDVYIINELDLPLASIFRPGIKPLVIDDWIQKQSNGSPSLPYIDTDLSHVSTTSYQYNSTWSKLFPCSAKEILGRFAMGAWMLEPCDSVSTHPQMIPLDNIQSLTALINDGTTLSMSGLSFPELVPSPSVSVRSNHGLLSFHSPFSSSRPSMVFPILYRITDNVFYLSLAYGGSYRHHLMYGMLLHLFKINQFPNKELDLTCITDWLESEARNDSFLSGIDRNEIAVRSATTYSIFIEELHNQTDDTNACISLESNDFVLPESIDLVNKIDSSAEQLLPISIAEHLRNVRNLNMNLLTATHERHSAQSLVEQLANTVTEHELQLARLKERLSFLVQQRPVTEARLAITDELHDRYTQGIQNFHRSFKPLSEREDSEIVSRYLRDSIRVTEFELQSLSSTEYVKLLTGSSPIILDMFHALRSSKNTYFSSDACPNNVVLPRTITIVTSKLILSDTESTAAHRKICAGPFTMTIQFNAKGNFTTSVNLVPSKDTIYALYFSPTVDLMLLKHPHAFHHQMPGAFVLQSSEGTLLPPVLASLCIDGQTTKGYTPSVQNWVKKCLAMHDSTCLGDAEGTLKIAWLTGDVSSIISVMYNWLSHFNSKDQAGAAWSHFPRARILRRAHE